MSANCTNPASHSRCWKRLKILAASAADTWRSCAARCCSGAAADLQSVSSARKPFSLARYSFDLGSPATKWLRHDVSRANASTSLIASLYGITCGGDAKPSFRQCAVTSLNEKE